MKKTAIIGGAIIVLGILFFIYTRWVNNIMKDRALTLQLSPALLKQLGGKYIYDFPYNPAPIQWDGKYLRTEN